MMMLWKASGNFTPSKLIIVKASSKSKKSRLPKKKKVQTIDELRDKIEDQNKALKKILEALNKQSEESTGN
jgi:hypothetical protein